MIESEQQEQYEVKQTSLETLCEENKLTFDIVRHQEAMIRLQNIIYEWFIDKMNCLYGMFGIYKSHTD
jgi:hypothetical protein